MVSPIRAWHIGHVLFKVKKLYLGVKTQVRTTVGTARTQNGDIDPWIFGAGLSYTF